MGSTDPKKLLDFVQFVNQEKKSGKSVDDLALEYREAEKNPASYVMNSMKDLGKKTDIYSLRKYGAGLGMDDRDFDGLEGVDFDGTAVNSVVEANRKVEEAHNKVKIVSEDDPRLDDLAEEMENLKNAGVDEAQAGVAGVVPTLTKALVAAGDFLGGESLRSEDNAEERAKEVEKNKQRLITDLKDDKIRQVEYKKSLLKTEMPFVYVEDVIRKFEKEHDQDPRKVVEDVGSFLANYMQAGTKRLEEIAEGISNDQDRADALAILDPSTDSSKIDLEKPSSAEFSRFFGELTKYGNQAREIDAYYRTGDKVDPEKKRPLSFEEEYDQKISAAREAKDETGFIDPSLANTVVNRGQALVVDRLKAYGLSAVNELSGFINNKIIPDDIESEYAKLKDSEDKSGYKDLFQGIQNDKLTKNVKEYIQTQAPSNVSGPVYDKFIDIEGVRLRVNDQGEFQGVIDKNNFIQRDLDDKQQAVVDKFNSAEGKVKEGYLKSLQTDVNVLALVEAVGREAVAMAPMLLASYVTGGLASSLRLGQVATSLSASAAAGGMAYTRSYVGNYESHLAAGNSVKDSEDYGFRVGGAEAVITALVGPLEASYGKAGANFIKNSWVKGAGDAAKSVSAKAGISQATKKVLDNRFLSKLKNNATDNLSKALGISKQAAGEVIEEVTIMMDGASVNYREGRAEPLSENDWATTVAVSAILGGSFGSVNSKGSNNSNSSKSLLHLGRNFQRYQEFIHAEGSEWAPKSKDFEAKNELIGKVADQFKIVDEISEKYGYVIPRGSEAAEKLGDLVLDRSRTPVKDGVEDTFPQQIDDLYKSESEKAKAAIVVEEEAAIEDDVAQEDVDIYEDILNEVADIDIDEVVDEELQPGEESAIDEAIPSEPSGFASIEGGLNNQISKVVGDTRSVPIQSNGADVRFDRDTDNNWINRDTGRKANAVELNSIYNELSEKQGGLVTKPYEGDVKDIVGGTVKQGEAIGQVIESDGKFFFESEGERAPVDEANLEIVLQRPRLDDSQITKVLQNPDENIDQNSVITDIDPVTNQGSVFVFGKSQEYVGTEYDENNNPTVSIKNEDGRVTTVTGDNALEIEKERLSNKLISQGYGSAGNLIDVDNETFNKIISDNVGIIQEVSEQDSEPVEQIRFEESGAPNAPVGRSGDRRGATSGITSPRAERFTRGSNAQATGRPTNTERQSTIEPTKRVGKSSGRTFDQSNPYESSNGKQYYRDSGKWRRASDNRAVGGRELERLLGDIADRVINSSNVLTQGQKIFGNSQIPTNFSSNAATVNSAFIEKVIKGEDSALYEVLSTMYPALELSGIRIVGYDNTAEYESRVADVKEAAGVDLASRGINKTKIDEQIQDIFEGRREFERFSQAENEGFRRGGKVLLEAALYLAASEGSTTKNNTKEQQELIIEDVARQGRYWVENVNQEYGPMDMWGTESDIWVEADGRALVKSTRMSEIGSIQSQLDRITIQNTLFPSELYKVIGFGRNAEGEMVVISEQNFVPSDRVARPGETYDVLGKMGFEKVAPHKYATHDYIISDITSNVLIDPDGNYRFIDPILRFNTFEEGQGGSRVLGRATADTSHKTKAGRDADVVKRNLEETYKRAKNNYANKLDELFDDTSKEASEALDAIKGDLDAAASKLNKAIGESNRLNSEKIPKVDPNEANAAYLDFLDKPSFESSNLPDSVRQKVLQGLSIDQKYIEAVAEKMKSGLAGLTKDDKLVMTTYNELVRAAYLREDTLPEKPVKTAQFKDGVVHMDLSNYKVEDVMNALFASINNDENNILKRSLIARLKASSVFSEFFPDQVVPEGPQSVKTYIPDTKVDAGQPNPELRENYEAARKIYGKQNVLTLLDGQRVRGRMMLARFDDINPSHDPNTFKQTPGFPQQDGGKTTNDRDYERDKSAQREVNKLSSNFSDLAFNSDIIVTKDGITMSGNGRTMGGIRATKSGKAKRYYEVLPTKLELAGIKVPSDIDLKEGWGLFMEWDYDTPVYHTSEFQRFNAKIEKAKNESDKIEELSNKISPELVRAIVQAVDSTKTPREFFGRSKNAAVLRDILIKEKVIDSSQIPDFFKETGNTVKLNATGKIFLRRMLLASILDRDTAQMLDEDGLSKQFDNLERSSLFLLENSREEEKFNVTENVNKGLHIANQAYEADYALISFLMEPGFRNSRAYTTTDVVMAFTIGASSKVRSQVFDIMNEAIKSAKVRTMGKRPFNNKYEIIDKVAAFLIKEGEGELKVLRDAKRSLKGAMLNPMEVQFLGRLRSQGFGADVLFNAKGNIGSISPDPTGQIDVFKSKALEISDDHVLSHIFDIVYSGSDQKLKDALNTSIEKSLLRVVDAPKVLTNHTEGGFEAIGRAVFLGQDVPSNSKGKILQNINDLDRDGLITATPLEIHASHRESFNREGIGVRDISRAMSHSMDLTKLLPIDFDADVLEDAGIEENVDDPYSYFTSRGFPEMMANLAVKVANRLPEGISRNKIAMQTVSEIILPSGDFLIPKYYPWTSEQKEQIQAVFRLSDEGFENAIGSVYLSNLINPKTTGLFKGFEEFFVNTLDLAVDEGALLPPEMEEHHRRLNPSRYANVIQNGVRVDAEIEGVDSNFLEVQDYLIEDGVTLYQIKDNVSGESYLVDSDKVAAKPLPPEPELQEALDSAVLAAQSLVPGLTGEIVSASQMAEMGFPNDNGVYRASLGKIFIRQGADIKTAFHEAAHAVIFSKFAKDPDKVTVFHKTLEAILKNGNANEKAMAARMSAHVSLYNANDAASVSMSFNELQAHEFLAELAGNLAASDTQITKPIWDKIIDAIRKVVLDLVGPDIPVEITTAEEAIDFINDLARQMRAGIKRDHSNIEISEDQVSDSDITFSSKANLGPFKKGDNVSIYTPGIGPEGFNKSNELYLEGQVTWLTTLSDGTNVVRIGKKYYNADMFSKLENGDIAIKGFAKAMQLESHLGAKKQAFLDELVSKLVEANPSLTSDKIYRDLKKRVFDKKNISKINVVEAFDLINSRKQEEVQEISDIEKIGEIYTNKNISLTVGRLVAKTPNLIDKITSGQGLDFDKAHRKTKKEITEELNTLLAPHMGTQEDIKNFYSEFVKEVSRFDLTKNDNMDPRIAVGVINRLAVRYASLTPNAIASGFADETMTEMIQTIDNLAGNASFLLNGFRSDFTGLTTTNEMETILDRISVGIAKEVGAKRVGKKREKVDEVVKELSGQTSITDSEATLILSDVLSNDKVAKKFKSNVKLLNQLVNAAIAAIESDVDVNPESIDLRSRIPGNRVYYNAINAVFNKAYWEKRKANGNSDFLNGINPIDDIKVALERAFVQNSGQSIADFYKSNPDVFQAIENAYLRMEKAIVIDSLGDPNNSRTAQNLLREYRKFNKRPPGAKADPRTVLAELFEDRVNGQKALDKTIDTIARQIKHAKDPNTIASLNKTYNALHKARVELALPPPDGTFVNATSAQFIRALNQGIRNIPEQELARFGIDVNKATPQSVLGYLVKRAAKDGNVSVRKMSQAIASQMNLSSNDAVEIANVIEKIYQDRLSTAKIKSMERALDNSIKPGRRRETAKEKMRRLIETGALDTDAYKKGFAQAFGLDDLSDSQSERVVELVDLMNSEDPNTVSDANREFQSVMRGLRESEFDRFMRSVNTWRYINLLSGYGTVLLSLVASSSLMAKRFMDSNLSLARRKGAFNEFRKYKKTHRQLMGWTAGYTSAGWALGRDALNKGAIILTHEDNPDEAIGELDLWINKHILRNKSVNPLRSKETQDRAKLRLAELNDNQDRSLFRQVASKTLYFAMVMPVMAVRTLQFIDVLLNTGAIERESFLVAWDEAAREGKSLSQTHEQYIDSVYDKMGVRNVIDEDGNEISFQDQMAAKYLAIEQERRITAGDNYVALSPSEKSVIAKQLVLDNRKRVTVGAIPDGLSSGMMDVINRNRKTVNSIANTRVLDASLLNFQMRGVITGSLGYMLTAAKNGAVGKDKPQVVRIAALMAGFIAASFVPIVKVVTNNYYNSYQHHWASLPVKYFIKNGFGGKGGVVGGSGIDTIRFDSRTGDVLINGVPTRDLNKLDGAPKNGSWFDRVFDKDSEVREVVELMQETKLESREHMWRALSTPVMSLMAMLAMFDWEEDDEGKLILKKRAGAWENLKVTGRGTGNYFRNLEIWGPDRKDNEFNVAGFHTRWTELAAASHVGVLGSIGDQVDLYNSDVDGTRKKGVGLEEALGKMVYGSYYELLGEGFGISANSLSTLFDSVNDYNDADDELDELMLDSTGKEKGIEAARLAKGRASARAGNVVGSITSSQLFGVSNFYRQTDRKIRELSGGSKFAVNDGTGSFESGGFHKNFAFPFSNKITNGLPFMNSYLLNQKTDLMGNPIPERLDLIVAPDEWEMAANEYFQGVSDDPISDFVINNKNVDSGKIFTYMSAAKNAMLTKGYYLTAEAQVEADFIWKKSYRKIMEKEFNKVKGMSDVQQSRAFELIASRTKTHEDYRNFIKANRKKVTRKKRGK